MLEGLKTPRASPQCQERTVKNARRCARQRQVIKKNIGFAALSNGFVSAEQPEALQAICDRLGPGTLQELFDRWMDLLPLPLNDYDRTFRYWRDLSMRQIEVSRTLVFDAPRHARGFFDALIKDNLDLVRPQTLELREC